MGGGARGLGDCSPSTFYSKYTLVHILYAGSRCRARNFFRVRGLSNKTGHTKHFSKRMYDEIAFSDLETKEIVWKGLELFE